MRSIGRSDRQSCRYLFLVWLQIASQPLPKIRTSANSSENRSVNPLVGRRGLKKQNPALGGVMPTVGDPRPSRAAHLTPQLIPERLPAGSGMGIAMRVVLRSALVAASVSACSTTNSGYVPPNPADQSTLQLCRVAKTHSNEAYRRVAINILIKRGATVEKCERLVASDNAIATGIAIGGAAAAAGVAAHNNGGGGYRPQPYGVAWDQFYNENYQLIWRCRDRTNGQFVDDYYCSSMAMVDSTWPGWSAI